MTGKTIYGDNETAAIGRIEFAPDYKSAGAGVAQLGANMLQVSPYSIPFETCSKAPEWPHGHCYHGVFFGGPVTNTGRCCWCGEDKALPWSMNPEKSHGQHHPQRAADRGAAPTGLKP